MTSVSEDPQNSDLSLLIPSPFLSWWYFLSAYDYHWRRRHLRLRAVEVRGGREQAILNLLTVRFPSLRSSLWVSGIESVLSACKWAADGWEKCSLICSARTAANQHENEEAPSWISQLCIFICSCWTSKPLVNTKYLGGHQFTQCSPAASSDLTTVRKNRFGRRARWDIERRGKRGGWKPPLHNSFFLHHQGNKMTVGTSRVHSNKCFPCLNLKFQNWLMETKSF